MHQNNLPCYTTLHKLSRDRLDSPATRVVPLPRAISPGVLALNAAPPSASSIPTSKTHRRLFWDTKVLADVVPNICEITHHVSLQAGLLLWVRIFSDEGKVEQQIGEVLIGHRVVGKHAGARVAFSDSEGSLLVGF